MFVTVLGPSDYAKYTSVTGDCEELVKRISNPLHFRHFPNSGGLGIPIMTVSTSGERNDEHAFLDSVEGEISFFRSIMRARPIGMHRHFHILAIRNAILKDTGRSVHIETLWEKLRKCYDLDALDAIVRCLWHMGARQMTDVLSHCICCAGHRSRRIPLSPLQLVAHIYPLSLPLRESLGASVLPRRVHVAI